MKYYRKEIPEQAILIFGQPFRFDFLATEDQSLIHELDKCIAKQRGGIIGITKEEYDVEVKKKETESFLQGSSKPLQHQRHELKAIPLPQDRRAVEVVANPGGRRNGMFAQPQRGRDGTVLNGRQDTPMPDPIQIPSPTQFLTPPVANISEPKK
jgi:hypothetical protein